MDCFAQFKRFMTGIVPSDKVAVVFHNDPDGVCSGVILAKIVERLRKKRVDGFFYPVDNKVFLTIELVKKLRGFNKIITTDLAVDQFPDSVKEVERFAEVLVVDHHKLINNLASGRTTFIKADFLREDSASYCASKLVFDLGNGVVNIADLDWVSCIGVIGDMAWPVWRGFLDNTLRKYGFDVVDDPWKCVFGECAKVISSAEIVKRDNIGKAFDVLYRAKSARDIISSELSKFSKLVDEDIAFWRSKVRNVKCVQDLELVLLEISPKYKIKSALSTLVSIDNPHITWVVADISGDKEVSVSARRQDRLVPLNKVMDDAVKGIPNAFGGGHVPAAGATLPKDFYAKFKEQLFDSVRKWNRKR